MKRFILCLALGAGILSSCSESQTSATRAELAGTYDLTLVGRYVFVTSSDQNELRVLDLEASPRNFVTAPNPLEPLSIPVLERPSNLTRDVVYTAASGQLDEGEGGPYIYARSFGSQEISIVAADPAVFQELHRLTAQGLVTAFAARTGDEIIREQGNRGGSVLYYAQQAGRDAKLFRVELPKPDALTKGSTVTPQSLSLDLTGRTVTALLVLPPPADQLGQELLVVATRGTTGSGGETFRVVVNNGVATRDVTYGFGRPVRLLATHPRAELHEDDEWHTCSFDQDVKNRDLQNPPAAVPTGQYVFGVLDENSCGGEPACSGVLAVDAATGVLAKDASGLDMLPITVGQALPTGLTLASRVDVNLPCQLKDEPTRTVPIVKRPLVGIVPMSNGSITLFDAVRMRPFDLDPAGPSFSVVAVDSVGNAKGFTEDQLATHLAVTPLEGVTKTETYRLVYELALPDLASVERKTPASCPAGSTCFEVDASAATEMEVGLGDVVVLRDDGGTCKGADGKEVDYEVKRMVASQGNPTVLVTELKTPNTSLPTECQDLPRITVRASGENRAFVVLSDSRGYRGRLGLNHPFEEDGRYYYHPSTTLEAAPKDIRITLNLLAPQITRGDQYIVTTLSHFLPYVFGVDTSNTISGLAAYRLPGPVVYTRVGDADLAYIAYPSADGILQVSLEAITDNSANTTGLVPFE